MCPFKLHCVTSGVRCVDDTSSCTDLGHQLVSTSFAGQRHWNQHGADASDCGRCARKAIVGPLARRQQGCQYHWRPGSTDIPASFCSNVFDSDYNGQLQMLDTEISGLRMSGKDGSVLA